MKVRLVYICEHCGYENTDAALVESCEDQSTPWWFVQGLVYQHYTNQIVVVDNVSNPRSHTRPDADCLDITWYEGIRKAHISTATYAVELNYSNIVTVSMDDPLMQAALEVAANRGWEYLYLWNGRDLTFVKVEDHVA